MSISEISAIEVEKIIGRKVDRSRKYAKDSEPEFSDHGILVLANWDRSCSGCFETVDGHPFGHYPIDRKHNISIGAGCDECGFTGKRRVSMWVPFLVKEGEHE